MKRNKTTGEKAASDRKYDIKTLLKSKIFIIFVISLLIEVFVCNYKHFDIGIPTDNVIEVPRYNMSMFNAYDEGGGKYIKTGGVPKLLIRNIDSEVGSIYMDISRNNKYNIDVQLHVRDTASDDFWDYEQVAIIKSIENSKYYRLNTAGVTKEISIDFKNLDDNEEFEINGITFNVVRPFRFIFIRFLLVFMILLLLYGIRPSSDAYSELYTGNKKQKKILLAITAVSAAFIIFTAVTTSSFKYSMYNDAAHSWVDGKVSLPYNVSDELKRMDNPYDRNLRDHSGVSYTWDAAYYNGKYYMYFGVVPLVLLYYPAKLIFNYDIDSYAAVMIFALISLLGAYMIMEGLNKRWFKNKIPFLVYAMSYAMLIFASGVCYFCRRPNFYETAQVSALAFGMIGLGCWLNAVDEDTVNKKLLCIGSACMALTVGCRPNYAIYSFVFIPLFWDSIIKKLNKINKDMVVTIACAAVPYIVVAAGLMYYNYIRFDSPFDFGNNYQLTIYDMRYSSNIRKIPIGIWNMYLQPPHICNTFPFVAEIWPKISYQGQIYLSHEVGGLFFTNIVTLFMLKLKAVRNGHKGSGAYPFAAVFIFLAFLQSVIIAATSGMLYRYVYDFIWCFEIIALLIAGIIICDNTDKTDLNIWIKLFLICFIFGIVFNILLSFRGETDSFRDAWPALYYGIERAAAFWL